MTKTQNLIIRCEPYHITKLKEGMHKKQLNGKMIYLVTYTRIYIHEVQILAMRKKSNSTKHQVLPLKHKNRKISTVFLQATHWRQTMSGLPMTHLETTKPTYNITKKIIIARSYYPFPLSLDHHI